MAPGTAEPPRDDAGSTPLAVMSFNIRYGTADDGANSWDQRRELVFGVLNKHEPDIVGLQEALRFQLDAINEAVAGYSIIGVGRSDGKTKGEYAAIMYRTARFEVLDFGYFWLSDTPEKPSSKTWGNNVTRICTWARMADAKSGATFYFYNTHLDHQSQPSRKKSVELIAAQLNARAMINDPVILVGDFNAGEDNEAIRYLTGELARASSETVEPPPSPGLRDAFRVVHPDATEVGTFGAFEGRVTGRKIDYVFVSESVTVHDASILLDSSDGRYPSDHYPVTAIIAIPAAAPPTPERSHVRDQLSRQSAAVPDRY